MEAKHVVVYKRMGGPNIHVFAATLSEASSIVSKIPRPMRLGVFPLYDNIPKDNEETEEDEDDRE